MQHQEKCILALQVHCQQEWLEIGSALSASAQTTLSHAARKTHWIQNRRLLPLQTTSLLFTALSDRFIVHQEGWKSGTTAWGSGTSYLGRTMLVYTTQWPQGPSRHPRHLDQWLVLGPEVTHTVTICSDKSPCCISKSVLKLSCCSKAFQSVWMQHF